MANRVENARLQARNVLAAHNITAAPVLVEKIAKARNIAIQFSPFDQELSGMAVVQNGLSIIGVNSLHHPNRQRFTIAHELGHHLLHSNLIDGTVHVDKNFAILKRDELTAQGTNLLEIEANAFASELLMPKLIIDEIVDISRLDMDDEAGMKALAKRFRVSVAALQNRLAAYS